MLLSILSFIFNFIISIFCLIVDFLVTIHFSFKTPEELAQAAKLRGNKYFKGGKFESAIQCYEEAINICPPDKVNEIATFYQNKAAANERLVIIFTLIFYICYYTKP